MEKNINPEQKFNSLNNSEQRKEKASNQNTQGSQRKGKQTRERWISAAELTRIWEDEANSIDEEIVDPTVLSIFNEESKNTGTKYAGLWSSKINYEG